MLTGLILDLTANKNESRRHRERSEGSPDAEDRTATREILRCALDNGALFE